jgi:hypothetical protein
MIHLNELIPGYENLETRSQIIKDIDDYALSIEFTQEEVNSIQDPRMILIAYEAMMYRRLKG